MAENILTVENLNIAYQGVPAVMDVFCHYSSLLFCNFISNPVVVTWVHDSTFQVRTSNDISFRVT